MLGFGHPLAFNCRMDFKSSLPVQNAIFSPWYMNFRLMYLLFKGLTWGWALYTFQIVNLLCFFLLALEKALLFSPPSCTFFLVINDYALCP